VPVGELLDVVDRTARTEDGPARERVVVRHPLQPFDARNFTAGALAGDGAWSFDHVTLEGARALAGERAGPPPFLAGPLPSAPGDLLELDDLVRFVEHPVRAFLRRRLGIRVGDFSDEVDDALAVELDGLGRWDVGRRMLEARLAGADHRTAYRAEIARGTLPPGLLAKRVVDAVLPVVEDIVAVVGALDGADPASVDVKVALGDGRQLTGTVPGVGGDWLRTVIYSRVAAKHRLAAWVRLLALTAADPERPFGAMTVGRARSGAGHGAQVTVARIAPLGEDAEDRRAQALAHLATLVDLYDRGMREPSPLCCESSAAYADVTRRGGNARAAARKAWESEWSFPKEDAEPEHELVYGGVLTFDDLFERAPYDDERGRGWDLAEPSRFGRYAIRLWEGLLACERLEDR
jgi:exodeoxyribonuclease V gamma subunit